MESNGSLSGQNLQEGLDKFLKKSPRAQQPTAQPIKQPATQPSKAAPARAAAPKERAQNQVVLRVLSTLGNPHVCGLTEIELFDD